jgi:hypothetical protein
MWEEFAVWVALTGRKVLKREKIFWVSVEGKHVIMLVNIWYPWRDSIYASLMYKWYQ